MLIFASFFFLFTSVVEVTFMTFSDRHPVSVQQ